MGRGGGKEKGSYYRFLSHMRDHQNLKPLGVPGVIWQLMMRLPKKVQVHNMYRHKPFYAKPSGFP